MGLTFSVGDETAGSAQRLTTLQHLSVGIHADSGEMSVKTRKKRVGVRKGEDR